MNRAEIPQFTLSEIQVDVGDHEFTKGLALYEKGAVKKIKSDFWGFSAVVSGTHEYHVNVSATSFDRGNCDCYIGQRDELCKHMIALAIAVVHKYRPTDTAIHMHPLDQAVCSGQVRDITEEELVKAKEKIKEGMKLIKSYSGSSAKWFQYQHSLTKGARLILLAFSEVPVCEKSALLCIDTLKKLDKRVLRGVDDSDGTVGDMMCQLVEVLNMFASDDPSLKPFILKKLPKGESFDWESGFGVT